MAIFKRKKQVNKKDELVKESSKEKEVKDVSLSDKNNLVLKEINYDILKGVLLSEKAGILRNLNKYCFLVSLKANKSMIKKAVENRYQVKVKDVNIVRLKDKPKYWRNLETRFQDIKKAVVTLKEGQKIEI